jgi:phosphonoacetaldehyde hydrolase
MNGRQVAQRCCGLKAVVLDWAGTVLDYGCLAPTAVFAAVFRACDVELTSEEIRAPMGLAKKVHLQQLLAMPAVAARWQTAHDRLPNDDDLEHLFKNFERLQVDCLPRFAELIPGALAVIAALRNRGLKIGSTTGYDGAMMEVLIPEARRRGYAPDSIVCSSDVLTGRPGPGMMLEALRRMDVESIEAVVKIDDTAPGIEEGLNGGVWTIGVAKTSSEVGLSEADLAALPTHESAQRIKKAYDRLSRAGAHYVVDSIADVGPCLDNIERRLATGEKP